MKIGIAGCGIMGRLLGLELINQGHEVSLFDKNNADTSNCSMAAAGMLAPIAELEKCGNIIYEMGLKSLNEHWPRIIAELNADIYFRQLGSLIVSHPKDESELTNFISMLDSKVKTPVYQQLSENEIAEMEPGLSKFHRGYYLPTEGQLDNQALMQALQKTLIEKNVKWYWDTKIESMEDLDFDLVFDCRGLGANSHDDLQAVRGELIWLHAPDVTLNRPIRLMHPRYHLYVAPRPNNLFVVGASEIYAEDYSEISVKTTLELLTAIYYLHPGFAEARIIKTVTHCRPAFPDHLPKIKVTKNCVAINGLYRHGYLIAPTLVEEVMKYVKNADHISE